MTNCCQLTRSGAGRATQNSCGGPDCWSCLDGTSHGVCPGGRGWRKSSWRRRTVGSRLPASSSGRLV